MGFEPTTTCLGSKDSTTELRPLADSHPTRENDSKSRKSTIHNSWVKFCNCEFFLPYFQATLLIEIKRD